MLMLKCWKLVALLCFLSVFPKNIHTSSTEEFFPRPSLTPLEISIKLDLLKCFGLRIPLSLVHTCDIMT